MFFQALPVLFSRMGLFNSDPCSNLLPYDGEAVYCGVIFGKQQSGLYLNRLLNTVEWRNDEAVIFGKHVITKRKTAWYGDRNYAYTYSNVTRHALVWTEELKAIKAIVEDKVNSSFNSCLLNLYHSGQEGVAWHSDDEKSLGTNTTIASVSFGAARKFSFKHKVTKQIITISLESGSLLVMKGITQTNWLHSLPKTTKVTVPRVNLTFRTIV